MSRKHQLINSAITVLAHNRDGSYRTQNDRRTLLLSGLTQLYSAGYQLNHVRYIKQKHIRCLVDSWTHQQLSTGSIKNRLSHFRWLLGKINRAHVIPSNQALAVAKRNYISEQNRSRSLTVVELAKIDDPLMRLSLEGQRLLGLRVEESLKIQPYLADGKHYVFIKDSWAKGGRERIIPLLTQEQRQWLLACQQLVVDQHASLIPTDVSYKTYRKRFEKACERAGINKRHGLRHAYAQRRYHELTGFACAVAHNGIKQSMMTAEQRRIDRVARLQVSQELGHSRKSIVTQYLGR